MALGPTTAQSPRTTGPADPDKSYVDWPAIIGGAILATAVSFVLITFGSGLGLSLISPESGEGVSMRWVMIAAGVWFVWVAISSFAAGGYIAGRLRRPIGDTADAVETRDGLHGLMVWAVGALIGTVLAASGVSGVAGAAGSLAGATADTAATAMEDQLDYFTGMIMRTEDGSVVDNPAAREEIGTVLARSMAEGEVTSDDRDYLVQVVAAETGSDQEAVEQRVDQVITAAQEARDAAVEGIEQARIAGVIATFLVAATLLISAAAAYFAATYGGQHRDRNISFRVMGH